LRKTDHFLSNAQIRSAALF